MKTAAIICEYNPFHNGHKYLIETAKNNGITHIVSVLGGNFTQRGDVSLISKFERAKMALGNGVDLVVELPITYAMANAQKFAKGGVFIAESLNCNNLFFGSECGNITLLENMSNATSSPLIKKQLDIYLSQGVPFAAARQRAVADLFENAEILENPNDNLAIEYISVIKKESYNIKPVAVKRTHVSHDSMTTKEHFASASFLRENIFSLNKDLTSKFMPKSAYYILENCIKNEQYAQIKNIEIAILAKLRSMNKNDFSNLPDISEGLGNRIFNSVKISTSWNDLIFNIKTKRYSLARIRRCVLSAFLGIDTHLSTMPISYIRVLGFTERGLDVIKNAKTTIPIITKLYEIKDDPLFDTETKSTDIYSLAMKRPDKCGRDMTQKIIKF